MAVFGREIQLKTLKAALGKDEKDKVPPTMFLWGLPSTGKTVVIDQALSDAAIVHKARMSAIELICGRRTFFESIIRQLYPDIAPTLKCDNLRILIRNLKQLKEEFPPLRKDRIVVVLEKVEELRKDHSDILDVFVSLQELTQLNICVILSSTLPLLKFSSVENMVVLPTIYFPQYSKDDIVKIITNCYQPKTSSPAYDPEVYQFYVTMVVNVFFQGCRDIRKLIRLTTSNWDFFEQLCSVEGQTKSNLNLRKLWTKIEPRFKTDFKALNSQLLPMTSLETNGSQNIQNKAVDNISKHSKYLLVASYIATHNPPASDKKFFVKCGSVRKRNNNGLRTKADENEKTGTLRAFELNRLKAIFAFLVRYCSNDNEHEVYEDNVDLLVQLTTLCQGHNFIQSLGEDSSGNFKYRCLADYDFILDVSRSINFELDRFLC